TRPEPDEGVEILERRWVEFCEALDELGIEPGDTFKIKAADVGDRVDADLEGLPRSGSQRRRILERAVERGSHGITSDEASDVLGIAIQSARPRFGELRDGRWLRETGKRRESDAGSSVPIFVATHRGYEALDRPFPRRKPKRLHR